MRQGKGKGSSRLLMLAIVVAIASIALLPAIASAATPTPTILLSKTYQSVAATFTASGSMGTGGAYAGKYITVQIKKPGRTYWMSMPSAKISSTGKYSFKYRPKLAGKFYVRARYRTTGAYKYSRTTSISVAKGPGVKTTILLASTTSTRDSGIFEVLKALFAQSCPEYAVQATFVGTGASIALGGSGDADVLLTHSPSQEVDFMKGIVAGAPTPHHGVSRYKVMYNDFVLVGPKANPAGVVATESARAAFGKIAANGSTFISRNDKSGTNTKEKEVWASAGDPQAGQSWYKASGTMGMAAALSACNELGAYTLSDRATWLNANNLGSVKNLQIVNQGDPIYFNQYSVIEVSNAKNWEGARDFSQWIRTPAVQEVIRTYGVDTYGQPLFYPNQGSW